MASLTTNTAWSVIESACGDLEELSNDIEGTSHYSVTREHLARWTSKIRMCLGVVRRNLVPLQEHVSRLSLDGSEIIAASDTLHTDSVVDAMTGQRQGGEGRGASFHSFAAGSIGPTVSGALHLVLDAMCTAVRADWSTCFVYNSRNEELVLAASVGKRADKPGTLRLSAFSGVESHVLQTGIAINVAHTHAEREFTGAQDAKRPDRTRSEVVFPLMKPGSSTHTIGVLQACNKADNGFFDAEDENKIGESAWIIASILNKFPVDVVNANLFDPAVLAPYQKNEADRLPPISALSAAGVAPPSTATNRREPVLVFRTARGGHLRRAEVLREGAAVKLPVIPTITEAIAFVTRVSDAWKNAVMLNIELQKEVARLSEGVKVNKREATRLQVTVNDLRRQLDERDAGGDGPSTGRTRGGSLVSGAPSNR